MVQIKLILYFLTYFFNKINPTSYTRWGRWSLLPKWKIEWGTSVGSTGSWYWRRFFSWPRQVDLKWFDATKTYVPTRKYVRTVFNVRLSGVPWFKWHFRSYLSSVVCLIRSSRTCQWHDGRACRNLAVFFPWPPDYSGQPRLSPLHRRTLPNKSGGPTFWLQEYCYCCYLTWFVLSYWQQRVVQLLRTFPG